MGLLLLRAHDLGDTRKTSSSDRVYEMRKKYHKMYYHFKPGKVYWMLLILFRKAAVAICALLFAGVDQARSAREDFRVFNHRWLSSR